MVTARGMLDGRTPSTASRQYPKRKVVATEGAAFPLLRVPGGQIEGAILTTNGAMDRLAKRWVRELESRHHIFEKIDA